MKKKTIASALVVGALVGQNVLPMYAANIQTVNPYDANSAVKKEEKETLTANVVGIDGYDGKIELPIGELNKDTVHAPQGFENYDFVNVRVGNTEITSIGTWTDSQGNEFWYYSTDGINATIFDEESLALLTVEFEKHVASYKVEYTYDENCISIEGPDRVKEGENLSFTINFDESEYRISSIMVNGKDYINELNKNTLTIPSTDINGDISVNITAVPITEYSVTYDDQYLMNGFLDEEAPTVVSKNGTYVLKFRYEPKVSVTYQLNQVRINGQELNLPDDVWEVGSVSKPYDLGNGMIATVKVESSNLHWGTVHHDYHYVLTITNVNSNLHVEKINFKDDDRKEVINQNLDYFKEIDEWHAEQVSLNNHQWKYTSITKEDNVILNREGDELQGKAYPQFIFVNLKEGYDGTTLKVYKNGSETENERLITIEELRQRVKDGYYDKYGYNENVGFLLEKIESSGKEYTHCLKVDGGVDVRYEYSAEKAKYQVKYDIDGGEWDYSDSNIYDYFDNSIIKIPYSIPSRENYTFEGWQVGNVTYAPGQYVDITKDKNFYDTLNDGTFTLKAKWQKNDEITKDTYWKYYVTLQMEQKDGSHKVIGTKDFSAIKQPGKNPQILLKGLVDNILEENNIEIPKGFEAIYDNLKTLEKNEESIVINIDAVEYKINYEVDLPETSKNPNTNKYTVLSDTIKLLDPIDAENDNVVFDGWYSDDEYKHKIDEIAIDQNKLSDITVYGRYKEDKNNDNIPDDKQRVLVKYDANGGENAPEEGNYLEGETYLLANKGEMSHPKKYAFAGWTTEKIEEVVSEQPKDIILPGTSISQENAGIYTYYAVWAVDENEDGTPDYQEEKYRLTYDANGGSGAPQDKKEYLSGQEVKLSEEKPIREKAVFLGWSKSKHKGMVEETPEDIITTYVFEEESMTVYAVWAADENEDGTPDYQEEKYHLTYDANGGSGAPQDKKEYLSGQEVKLSEEKPIREKAVFLGWSKSKHEGMVEETPEDIITTYVFEEESVTVHAVWAADENEDGTPDYQEEKYHLTYDANGGSGAPQDKKEYLSGQEVKLSEEKPIREKAVFLGWSKSKHEGMVEETPKDIITTYVFEEGNVTVYAVWAADENEDGTPDYQEEKYHLTYDANGGSGAPQDKKEYLSGQEVKLSEEKPVREKAVFLGWSKSKHKGMVEETPEDIITTYVFEEGNVTVYAVWAADENENGIPDYQEEKYNLTYDANGGSGAPQDKKEYLSGQEVKLSEEKPIREKAVFLGWSRTKHEGMVEGTPEDIITAYVFEEGNMTVYAVWAADENENGIPDYTEPETPITPDNPDNPDNLPNDDVNNDANNDGINDEGANNIVATTPGTDSASNVARNNPITQNPNVGNDADNENGNVLEDEETEDVDNNETPLFGEENEDDHKTPLSKGDKDSSMAFLNLLLTILSVLGAVVCFVKKYDKFVIGISAVSAIGSTIAFFMTQTLTGKIIMADAWTILFIVIVLVQVGAYILKRNKEE